MWKKVVLWVVVVGAVLAVAIQFVPYGRDHTNPDVVQEPAWPDERTRELAVGACFDCHSNETAWPWYSHIAPVSWFLTNDVTGGREHLNFSEWQNDDQALGAAEALEEGSMPSFQYKMMHSDARLSDQEKAELAAGLRAIAQ
jgi:hypothetical protein